MQTFSEKFAQPLKIELRPRMPAIQEGLYDWKPQNSSARK